MTDETPSPDAIPVDPPAAEDPRDAKISQLEKQISDYKLLVAELQTSMRRLQDSAKQERKYAHEPLARDLLGSLDNLDRALDAAQKAGETGPLSAGVSGTLAQILDALKRSGVEKIAVTTGSKFDPMRHQAVSQQPDPSVPPGAVVTVLQSGFTLYDRVLRPATVVVAAE
ncbi:MAG: nucleotide exchange factor GrpE [Gemmataceae bacterium]